MLKVSVLSILFFLLFAGSCNEFSRVQKSEDYSKKFEYAQKYYAKEDFSRAQILFEQLVTYYRGTELAEKMYYYYVYCFYYQKMYSLAAFHFRNYCENFPSDKKAEECNYMYCYCEYTESLPSNLDQTDSKKAVDDIQLFIALYPQSNYIPYCNQLLDELRHKLMQKQYDNAKLYYTIEDYKAAGVAFNLLLKDYPDTEHKDEVNFLIMKSYYLLAKNSIETKKAERYKLAYDAYQNYMISFSQGAYVNEAKVIGLKAEQEYNKHSKN